MAVSVLAAQAVASTRRTSLMGIDREPQCTQRHFDHASEKPNHPGALHMSCRKKIEDARFVRTSCTSPPVHESW
eukprot:2282179-Amphidinium_carterae.1